MRNIFLLAFMIQSLSIWATGNANLAAKMITQDCDLPAPTNLHTTEVGTNFVTIEWDLVPQAVGYQIKIEDINGNIVLIDGTPENFRTITDLEPGAEYNVYVASICADGTVGKRLANILIVPIVVELVISSDNPLGNLSLVCEKEIQPMAECEFDVSKTPVLIGKIKSTSTGEVFIFRITYINLSETENNYDVSKIELDLVNPKFYSEQSFQRPDLYTDTYQHQGIIIDHALALSREESFCKIRIFKKNGSKFIVNLQKINTKDEFEFVLSYPQSKNPNKKAQLLEINNKQQFVKIVSNIVSDQIELNILPSNTNLYIGEIINANGSFIKGITLNEGYNSIQVSNIPLGLYFIKVSSDIDYKIIKFIKQD